MKTDPKKQKSKPRQYTEGPKAKKNFEDVMKGLFRVPKPDSKKGKD
jgi:hypothetical protein